MKSAPSIFAFLLPAVVLLTGCAQEKPVVPGFATPWAGVYHPSAGVASASQHPEELIADGDIVVARSERWAWGPTPFASISSATTYTYESLPIATPGGSGYHYRWVVQQSISAP